MNSSAVSVSSSVVSSSSFGSSSSSADVDRSLPLLIASSDSIHANAVVGKSEEDGGGKASTKKEYLPTRSTGDQDDDNDDNDDGNYDDEAFEELEEAVGLGPEEPVENDQDEEEDEYSADGWEQEQVEDEQDAVGGSSSSAHASVVGAAEIPTVDPLHEPQNENLADDVPGRAEQWARHNVEMLQSRRTLDRKVQRNQPPFAKVANEAMAKLVRRLQQQPLSRSASRASRTESTSRPLLVSSSLLECAKVHHLLALSALEPPPLGTSSSSSSRTRKSKSISTFCLVKSADVAGKLATMRWETTRDVASTSLGTLEFLTEATNAQRRVVKDHDTFLYSVMKPQAMDLDRVVQVATQALQDSRELMETARRVLILQAG